MIRKDLILETVRAEINALTPKQQSELLVKIKTKEIQEYLEEQRVKEMRRENMKTAKKNYPLL